eukprot:g8365.t1
MLADFQVLCIPGGFSYGDDIGAGVIFAQQLHGRLGDAIGEFLQRDTLVLGICNGFQVLLKSGILPDGTSNWPPNAAEPREATLTWNDNGKYTALWVHLKVESPQNVFLRGIDEIELPLAHAEGRLAVRDDGLIRKWEDTGQIAIRYSRAPGAPVASACYAPDHKGSMKESGRLLPYPLNPNGSVSNIAGLSDATGDMPNPAYEMINRFAHAAGARIESANGPPEESDVRAAVERAGFTYEAITDSRRGDAKPDDESRSVFLRFIISAPLGVAVMVLAMSGVSFPGAVWLQFALTLPIVAWAGWPFFVNAWKSLRQFRAEMDTLIALGTGTAFVASTAGLLAPGIWGGPPPVYFEAAGMITVFVLLGRWLEGRAKARTSQAVSRLLDLQADTARVIRDGEEIEVPIDELKLGDRVAVRPGERVAADGTVDEGESAVDESMMTGESMPVVKRSGDEVIGGTLNTNGRLIFQVKRLGAESALQQIVSMVRDAQGTKAPIARLADRVAGVFVPFVLVAALVTLAAWLIWGTGDSIVANAIQAAVAVLVVACPCALGLATPTAVMVAMGRGAEQGLLIKDGRALETAQGLEVLLIDKTGTVTAGKPEVTDIAAAEGVSERELLEAACAVERYSEHPLAAAIVARGKSAGIELKSSDDFQAVEGRGAEALVDGKKTVIGSSRFLRERKIDVSPLEKQVAELSSAGKTPVLVAIDGKAAGVLAVADPVKSTSAEAVGALRQLGLEVVMVTGDLKSTAKAVAQQLEFDSVVAEVLPAEKAEQVTRFQQNGRSVGMVGDGINDAPALAAADVGFAIGTGTDVAIESSDVTLIGSDLGGIAAAIRLSRRTMRTIKQNLFFAFAYNTIGIPIAAGALYPVWQITLPPMFAAAAMAASSVSVVLNSLRLKAAKLDL